MSTKSDTNKQRTVNTYLKMKIEIHEIETSKFRSLFYILLYLYRNGFVRRRFPLDRNKTPLCHCFHHLQNEN